MFKKWIFCLSFVLLAMNQSINVYAQDDVAGLRERVKALEDKLSEREGFNAFWKDGLRLETTEGDFRIMIGGRINADFAVFSADDDLEDAVGEFEDGAEMRRARFYIKGKIYDNVEFKIDYDFTGGEPTAKDVYIGLVKVPLFGTVRIGHQQEPFSRLQGSTKYATFMEKGLQHALSPRRNTGILTRNTALEKRMFWSTGVFLDADKFGDSTSMNSYNLSVRLTGLPIYEEKGRRIVHLGTAFSFKYLDEEIRFREYREAHLAPRLVDTGDIAGDSTILIGTEAAVVHGSLFMMGEYIYVSVDAEVNSNPRFHGYYVLASYFLTGESRPYSRSSGSFTRVRPKRNFRFNEGAVGAWELSARYSGIDLNDKDVTGGELRNVTAGITWYLNPNTKIMANYIYSDLDDVGHSQTFQMRFHLDL